MSRSENQNFFAPPADAKAALYFLEGQYQFNWREGSVERTKFLSPAQIGRAFRAPDVFDSGWLETFVMRFAQSAKTHKVLSVMPAARRKILITDPRRADERESGDSAAPARPRDSLLELEIPLPTLLLLGSGRNYYLWATLDRTIGRKSKICHAPFPNLNSSGSICFGQNAAPECRPDAVESVWRLILDSPFNSHQTENRCRTHAGDARLFLAALSGKKTFPKKALMTTEDTVDDLWQSLR